jgi:tetratricopeptide (TPR) repeat protein
MKWMVRVITAVLMSTALPAVVLAVSPEVARLQQEWAEINYRVPKDQREQRFAQLVKVSEQMVTAASDNPDLLIWHGIIESTYAGVRGGMGALGHVKSARRSFERAIEINPGALEGSALTSLGSLYYQVPGWPIGFGDDRKALEFLRKGLAANPDGIDANYFYGDYLFRSGDLAGAEQALRKAMRAPPRPGRALADDGRKQEIEQLLQKIADKKR